MKKLILSTLLSFVFALCCVGAGITFFPQNYVSAEGTVSAQNTDINDAITNALDGAKLLYDESKQYFYFEDGMYPQEYAGMKSDFFSSATATDLNFAINNAEYPIYIYNYQYYILVTAPKTQTVKLGQGNVTFTAGDDYWFKFTPIRWRVSDYGTPQSEIRRFYDALQINAVSDVVLNYGAIQANPVTEGWSYSESSMHGAITGRFADWKKDEAALCPQNIVAYNCSVDSYSQIGTDQKVTTEEMSFDQYIQASIADVKENMIDVTTTGSDLVCMLMGVDCDQKTSYSTRDLVSLNNGKKVNASGMITSAWLSSESGVRLSACFKLQRIATTLMKGSDFNSALKTFASNVHRMIQKISFYDFYNNGYPYGLQEPFEYVDVSEKGDKTIFVCYNENDGTFYVISYFLILANPDSSGMFAELSYLEGIDFSNFNTCKVTNMSYMFNGCSSLTSLDLSNFDTSKVTDMSSMFSGCIELEYLNRSSMLYERSFMGYDNYYTVHVQYDYSNPFGMIAGDFGEIARLPNRRSKTISSDFDSLSELFATFMSNFEIPTNGMEYAPTISSSALADYTQFYNKAKEIYQSSPIPFCHSVGNIDSSAVIGVNHPYSMIFGTYSDVGGSIDFQKCIANLFGFENKDLFMYYAQGLAELYAKHRTDPAGTNEALENGCFYTSNGSFVFPIAVRNNFYSVVTYVILDTNGLVSVWVDYMEGALCSTNHNGYYNISSPLYNEHYGKNVLFMTGYLNFNTSNVTDMSSMFNGCSSLTSLDLSNFDTSKVTSMYFMFYECRGITSLNLSNFDTSNVTNIGGMFNNCRGLISLDLSNFDTSNVTRMHRLFASCHALTSLDLSNFDTSQATNMLEMFFGCRALSDLNISNFNTSKVTGMASMFRECRSLSNLDLSNFDTSNVTNMSYMFSDCSGLVSLNLSSFDTSNVTSLYQMFGNCAKFTNLNLSNFNTSNVTNMSYMFSGCSSLVSLNLSSFDTTNVTNMSYMFNSCNNLTSLNLSNFDTSNVTTMQNMFNACSSLTGLDVSHFNTSKVTIMTSMFYGCSSLTSLDVSNFNTSKVTAMNATFYKCEKLTILDVTNFDTSLVTNMNSMFDTCSGLTSLKLLSFDTSNVTSMGWMFNKCENLKNVYVSESWSTAKVTTSTSMFSRCTALVGGNGTAYDSTKIDKTYARIDAAGAPGYLTSDKVTLLSGWNFNAVMKNLDPNGVNITTTPQDTAFNVVFDYYTSPGKYEIGGVDKIAGLTGVDVSAAGNGSIMAYGRGTETIYVLSEVEIYANTSTSFMFMNFRALQGSGVSFRNFNASNVTFVDNMFYVCNSLDYVDMTGFDASKITSSTDAFKDCSAVVYVPENWTITISGKTPIVPYLKTGQNFNSILKGGADYTSENTTVKKIVFDYNTPYLVSGHPRYYVDGVNALSGLTVVDASLAGNAGIRVYGVGTDTIYVLSDAKIYANADASYMFYNFSGLESIVFNNFDTSNVTNMSEMFRFCRKLKEIDLSNFKTSKVTTMSRMFHECNTLSHLDLSSFDTSKVTSMMAAFAYMYNLTSLDLSNFDTSSLTRTDYMFRFSTKLVSVDLSSFNTSKVTTMSYMFDSCSVLETVYVSDRWTTSSVASSVDMFAGCSSLKGGNGTTWTSANVDKTYARVDASGTPGYLTYKATGTGSSNENLIESNAFDSRWIWLGVIWMMVAAGVAAVILRKKKATR